MVWCITSMLNSITSMNSIKSEDVKCGPSSDIILRELLFLVHKWCSKIICSLCCYLGGQTQG